MLAPGSMARAASCRNLASPDVSSSRVTATTTIAVRIHFATNLTGSRLETRIRPICSATLPCSRLRKTGESCSDDGSSVANSTADNKFSRRSGSVCSTCDAISSFAGRCSIRRRHVTQTATTTAMYTAPLRLQRTLSLSSQYQSIAATMAMHSRNVTTPAQSPRATINHSRRRAKWRSLPETMGSSVMLI